MKSQFKKILGSVLHKVDKVFYEKKLSIFNFHEITNQPSDYQKKYKLYHSVEEFQNIIEWISKNYDLIFPNEIEKQKNQRQSALITFDDGFDGVFKNALPFLIKKKIPSLHFLNMGPIIENKPSVISIIEYLNLYDKKFKKFLLSKKIKIPIYEVNPSTLYNFEDINSINYEKILRFQGYLVQLETLKKYQNNKFVFYGNHLYDHWNIINLDQNEISKFYYKNQVILKEFKNFIDIFAFTHGIPIKNFSKNNLNQILSFNPKYIFFSSGGVRQFKNKIIDRTFLNYDEIENKIFYYRKFRAKFINLT